MPKVSSRNVWHAEVELEICRLALSVQYMERGLGSKKKRILIPTDWLDKDGQTIIFDLGKRLKGWLKAFIASSKKSMVDTVQHGVICKSLPQAGYIPIATLNDIQHSRTWHSFPHRGEYDLNGLPEPEVEPIQTKIGTMIFSMWYVLGKPIVAKAMIYSFAYGIRPEAVENWLRVVGEIKGLGDKHSSSEAYGCFTVKNFRLVNEQELSF